MAMTLNSEQIRKDNEKYAEQVLLNNIPKDGSQIILSSVNNRIINAVSSYINECMKNNK